MFKLILSLFIFFPALSYAKCTSFSFGVNSPNKNEFAFVECGTKQVFHNSDLFIKKRSSTYFIGESLLVKKTDFNKINKALKFIIKKSKKVDIKKIFDSHGFHFTIGKQSYQVNLKSFNLLKSIHHLLRTKSKNKNGVLIKKSKFYKIKDSINGGPIDMLKLKASKDFYFYNGLYWSK